RLHHGEGFTVERASTSWIEAGTPALVLAPMQGVTDAAMRALLSEVGGFTFCVTEFLRVSQGVPGPRAFRGHAPELAGGGRTPGTSTPTPTPRPRAARPG